MRGLVATHRLIMKDELEDRADREAADQLARNLQSHVKPRIFHQNELVLIKINKDIREGHKLRAKATGPWRITAVLNDCVEVKDAFTGRQPMDRVTHLPTE